MLPCLLLPVLVVASACASEDGPTTAPAGVSVAAAAGDDPGSTVVARGGRQLSVAGATAPCNGPATAVSTGVVTPVVERAEPVLPVTYTDSRGKDVTITDVSRILALDVSGTLGATVYALGLGDRLVGRDISTGIHALADLPVVTHNGHQLNGEAILALDPSVVLTDYGIGPLEVQLQIENSGIPVVILAAQNSRAQIAPQIRAVARALGVDREGELLAGRVSADLAAAEAKVTAMAPQDRSERLRMAFLYIRGNAGVYHWLGKGSGADDLIRALGGIDVASELGVPNSRPLNAEGLVAADPEMFLMMSKGLASVGGLDGLRAIPGIGDTTAGRHGCVVDMIDHQILSFGPQFPATLEALATAVYGSAAP